MADDEGADAERPAETRGQHEQQEHRLAEPGEGREEEPEREREGEERRALAVPEGRGHLVVREGRPAGDPDLDVGELWPERSDDRADALDRTPVAGEAPALALGLDQNEEESLVPGEEVARAGALRAHGEERTPRGAVGRGPIEPRRDLGDQIVDEVDV